MMRGDFSNLCELIFYQSRHQNKKLLNFKENGKWRSFSSEEFLRNAIHFALALKEVGLKKGEKVAIYSYQNPIWLIVDFAVLLAGGVSVPIFHNISKENLLFQLEESEVKFIFADNPENFSAKNYFDKIDCLQNDLPELVAKVISYGFEIENSISFDEMLQIGFDLSGGRDVEDFSDEFDVENINLDDLATIIYTSGSTGNPKGVELSHRNLVCQIKDAKKCFKIDKKDKILSFLPLAHIFERMVMMFYISRGAEIYFVDDVASLSAFLREVKPNLMTVVPRVLEKVYGAIKEKSSQGGFLKRKLAGAALKRAMNKDPLAKNGFCDFIFDSLVYKKYREALGGNMNMMICGGAALSQDVEKFFHNIGLNLFCGYGLTEASPVLAVNYFDNYRFGTVGKAFDSVQLKIAEDGELLAFGCNIMKGYHKNKEKTDEVLCGGWLKTGDLAEISDDGFVKIVGRKKELFKTANGKYVRPVPIEQKIMQEISFLTGAIIVAEGRSFVSALLFVDLELIENAKKKVGFKGEDLEFVQSEELQNFVQKKIDEVNFELDRGEQIFKFAIIGDKISIEGGEITPSMKLKRGFLEQKYRELIDGFYR